MPDFSKEEQAYPLARGSQGEMILGVIFTLQPK